MPAKGRSRPHEAIALAPSGNAAPTIDAPHASAAADNGPWQLLWVAEATLEAQDALSGEAIASLPAQGYRVDDTTIEVPDAAALRAVIDQSAQEGSWVTFPAAVEVGPVDDPDHTVTLLAEATAADNAYTVDYHDAQCSHDGSSACTHLPAALDALEALLDGRRPRSGERGWEGAVAPVAEGLAVDHERSLAARAVPAPAAQGVAWSEDPSGFQAAYREARARMAAGEPAVPFMDADATGGLGARDGGRGFGVELEFDLAPGVNQWEARRAIGRDLHAAGLTPHEYQEGYHDSYDFSGWRYESDSTVTGGEVISPILYDEPESWGQLRQACEVIRRHGGAPSARTGGHVHVSVGDFDHRIEAHHNLLGLFAEHEDTLYRLAQRPGARAHRGPYWCQPNRAPAQGYTDLMALARSNPHGMALNFGAAAQGHSGDHVEFRLWDGSLEPGTIQAQVNLSLGLTDAAFRAERGSVWGHEPIGQHRRANAGLARGQRLTGERWLADTASFRRLVDRALPSDAGRAQAAALFAATRWQRTLR